MIYTKVCKQCGKPFETNNPQKIYCNDKHYLPCPVCSKPVEKKDFKAFLTCINLAVDPLEELSLYLPENLRKCSRLRFLDQDGSWQDLPFERTADGITVNMRFDHTVPVCITLA